MNEITHLVEQHVLEAESHLRHIDELMTSAHTAAGSNHAIPHDVEARITQIRQDRDRLAQELSDIRRQGGHATVETAARAEGLKRVLQTVGAELEKAFTAIFDKDPL